MPTAAERSPLRRMTGIGSLPHHNIDAALEWSFRMGAPFLPQIPIRNAWEYMIAQALEGLPGLQAEANGTARLNPDIWASRSADFERKLGLAFALSEKDPLAFESFEPSAATSSGWQPFLWEISERATPVAKVQISGPFTSQWAIQLPEGARCAELSGQIYRLTLARALAMTRRIQSTGAKPLLYIDEPGLYGLSASNPRHLPALTEIKLMVRALQKEGVRVGVHCCSNADWKAVLGLGTDYLSIDTELSLPSLLESGEAFRSYLRQGGRLSLGVIPTARSAVLRSLSVPELFAKLLDAFARGLPDDPEAVKRVLKSSLYTPACGLALHTVSDAELVLEALEEFHDYCTTMGVLAAPAGTLEGF